MVSAECPTTTETTTETTVSENLPTTIVGQSITKEESRSADGSESAPQEKQNIGDEDAKVASTTERPQPQPVSVPSSAVSSPSASGSVSRSGSPSRGIAPPAAGSASVPNTTVAPIPLPPMNSTGPLPSPPTHPQNQHPHAQNPPMQVKSLSPQPPAHPPTQAHAHPLHPQGHPPVMHHPTAFPPPHYHPAHVFHPHYPPPLHPHMYHPHMWHPPPPHHHPNSPAAYIKPYSAVMRSQPHIKRTSKYMLMEQGVQVASPTTQGSSRSPVPQEVESSQVADRAEETKEEETFKRPASEMSNSSDKEKEDVPEDLRNKKMKATDCLLFAASLLAPDGKKEQATDENAGANGNGTESSTLGGDDGEYITTGVKPAKKIFQEPMAALDDGDPEKDENWPKDVDVLCGRGGLINKHPGNVVYRKIVDYNKPFYQSVHKKHRILVSQSIVQSILNFGGRFMIMEKGKEWTEIEFKRAVQKTSQALRERIITGEELKKEEEKNKNGESKSSEGDEGIEMGEGEEDDEEEEVDGEKGEEEIAVKSEEIPEKMNGIVKGALAI